MPALETEEDYLKDALDGQAPPVGITADDRSSTSRVHAHVGLIVRPPMIVGLYWRKFNATGAMAHMCVGLGLSIVCLLLGPNMLGDDAPFPLVQQGRIAVPIGVLAATVGMFVGARHEAAVPASSAQPGRAVGGAPA